MSRSTRRQWHARQFPVRLAAGMATGPSTAPGRPGPEPWLPVWDCYVPGRDTRPLIPAATKSEARRLLKVRLGLDRLPAGTLLWPYDDRHEVALTELARQLRSVAA